MQKSRIIPITLIFITILLFISTVSLADEYTPGKFGSKIYVSDYETQELKDIGGQIVGIIQVVGTMVSVGMMIIIGIRYVMGSAEERAGYKKTLFPYIIGAVLIFGATNLAQIIYTWAKAI